MRDVKINLIKKTMNKKVDNKMDKIELKGKKFTKALGTATLATAVLFSATGNVSYAAEKPNTANGKAPYLSDTVLTDIDGDLLGTVVDGTEGYGDFGPDIVGGINPDLDLNGNGILDFEEEEEAEPNPIEISPEDDEPVVIDYGDLETEGNTSTPSVETTQPTVAETTETPSVETTQPTVEATTETPVAETTETPSVETTESTVETTTETPVAETTEPSVETTTETPVEATTEEPTVEATTETPFEATTEEPTVEATTETPVAETTQPTVEETTEPKGEEATTKPKVKETTKEEPTVEETTEPKGEEATTKPKVKETTKESKKELSLDTVKLTKEKPYIDVPGNTTTAIVAQRPFPLVYEVGSPVSHFETLKYGMWVQGEGGKDLQHTLKVESNIDFNKPGEYVVKYTAGEKGKEYVMYVLAIVEGKAPNKDGVKAPTKDGVKAPNKDGVKAPNKVVKTTNKKGVKAQTKVVNNAVKGVKAPNKVVKTTNKKGVKAPNKVVKTTNKKGVKAQTKVVNNAVKGVKAQTKVVNNAVNGVKAPTNEVKGAVVPNTLGGNTNAVGGKAPTTVDNTTTIENVDVNKGLGSTLNKSESLEGSAVDKVKVGNDVKESEKQLPDTGETSTNTGIIAGLLMAMGLGFLVKRKKSVNQ